MFEKLRQEFIQKATIQHERNTREDHEGFVMCDNGLKSQGAPKIFHGMRYREWMKEVWISYQFYVQRMKEDPLEPTLCLDQRDVLVSAYNKYALENGHHPESCRVLKALFERYIEGEQVPFPSCVITSEEQAEIEKDTHLPSYSRAFLQDARRSKCINMLKNKIKMNLN